MEILINYWRLGVHQREGENFRGTVVLGGNTLLLALSPEPHQVLMLIMTPSEVWQGRRGVMPVK